MASAQAVIPTGYDVAKAWSAAPTFMPHGAGCSCAGHVALHLDPAAVEADVLDYLSSRYEGLGVCELVDLIAARRAARGVRFTVWLGSLDTVPLSAEARARLLTDLHATIGSLALAR